MPKTVLHLFHADPASIQTVPALAERLRSTPDASLEVYVFGPAERMLADPDETEFNAQIDALVTAGVQVTTCIGIAQQIGSVAAFAARGLALEIGGHRLSPLCCRGRDRDQLLMPSRDLCKCADNVRPASLLLRKGPGSV